MTTDPPARPVTDPAVDLSAGVRAQLREVLDPALDTPAVWFDSEWTTWGQIARSAAALEAALQGLDIARRAPVVLVLRNRPSAVAALLGTLAHGRPPVLTSSLLPAPQVRAVAEAAGAGVVVLDEADHDAGLDGELAGIGVRSVVLPAGPGEAIADVRPVETRTTVPRPRRPEQGIDPEVALLVPTSGTTGAPKRIPVPWSQLPFPPAGQGRRPVGPPARPPVIHALSMATITGARGIFGAVARGRSIAMLDRVDVDAWTSLVERFGVRRAGLPPAAMRMILDREVPQERLSGLEAWMTGSAPLDPALQREFEERYGVPVLVAYGATELAGQVASWTLETHRKWSATKLGAVGRANDGVELRVVDESTGEPLGADEVGILTVRLPGAAEDDWIRTSDRARIDVDGFLFIVGRADDVVIRGGYKVSLGELEELFRQHPAVRDVGAVGLDDRRLGQLPAVAVVLKHGRDVAPEELRTWASEHTARYKVPAVRVVETLPMGASHKVDRSALRRVLQEQLAEGERT